MSAKQGLFIIFEGIDGAGKSTQSELLAKALSDQGCPVLITRDPGDTVLGQGLRNVLLHSTLNIDPGAEAMLYVAARTQLVAEKILPALNRGEVVISDRFTDSTLAYQGFGRGVCRDFIERLNDYASQGLLPDLTIVLDMDPSQLAVRLKRPLDRMEREGQEFLQRVRQCYLDRVKENPGRYLVLDASLPPHNLLTRILEEVEKRVNCQNILGQNPESRIQNPE